MARGIELFIPEPFFSLATDIASAWIRGRRASRLTLMSAGVLGAAAGLLHALVPKAHPFDAIFGVAAALLIIGVIAYQRALERSLRARRFIEIEREVEAHPDKAKPAWDLASAKLEEYVARNLSHVAWIFVLVLVVMAIGFVLIGWGVFRVFATEALAPSVVAAASGIVVEFIAATFLLIYRSTMQQARSMLRCWNASMRLAWQRSFWSLSKTPTRRSRQAKADLARSLLSMYGQSRSERSR
jgi:O-antigen/teichoic acid export membrane protein